MSSRRPIAWRSKNTAGGSRGFFMHPQMGYGKPSEERISQALACHSLPRTGTGDGETTMAAVTGISRARRGAKRGPAGPGMPAILMYHSISPDRPDPYLVTVSPGRFGQQMGWLARRGLRGVSVAELLAARARGDWARLVALTFDD